MLELSTTQRGIRGDGGDHHEKLGLRECHVRVISPSLKRLVRVPIRRVITPIQGLISPVWQIVLLISDSLSYAQYRSHLHPPSLSFSSTTLASSQEQKVKSSLSISPCHHHELTLSAAYTEYSIHRVQHTLSTAYTEYSIHQVQLTPSTAYTEYSMHWAQHTPSTPYT